MKLNQFWKKSISVPAYFSSLVKENFRVKKNSEKYLRKIIMTGLLVVVGFMLFGEAKAQYRCGAFNLSTPDSGTRLNGIWKIEHSNSEGLLHTTVLTMKGWGGVSITSYYDKRESRIRNVAQNHLLCMRNSVLVIVGFMPFDSDTGEKVSTYGADNFILTRNQSGNLIGINYDDNQNGSGLKITFLSNLDKSSEKIGKIRTTKKTRGR